MAWPFKDGHQTPAQAASGDVTLLIATSVTLAVSG
jgi:hypothetical protein